MHEVQRLADEIRAYCREHADPIKATKWQRYFVEGYDAWGLLDKEDPFWSTCQRDWLARYSALGVDGFLDAGALLFASGKYEEGAIATLFIKNYVDQINSKRFARFTEWFAAGLGNWAHTDILAGEVLSPVLMSGRVKLKALEPWCKSPHRYQRRAVPVAMVVPAKQDHPVEPILSLIRPLMLDGEKVVHQGLGWVLRECWKKEPALVEPFLLEFKDTASRVIYQAATEKMTAQQKARFKKERAKS